MKRQMAAITCVLLMGCATTSGGDVDALKPTITALHENMRWKQLQQFGQQLLPERRDAFAAACLSRDDEKNLFVTEYQLQECKVLEDKTFAVCLSSVSWYRLPSNSTKTVTLATTLKWKGGMWLVDRQSDGPFGEELSLGGGAQNK